MKPARPPPARAWRYPAGSPPWTQSTSPAIAVERRGRLNTARLVAEHGAEMRGPVLVRILAVDCPRMQAAAFHEVYGVHLPQLSQGGLREGQPLVFPPICAILLRVERITHAYRPKRNGTPIQRLREYGH